jgi:hypothetical protein
VRGAGSVAAVCFDDLSIEPALIDIAQHTAGSENRGVDLEEDLPF